MRVTSIVLNWNRAEDTLTCLAALQAQTVAPTTHHHHLLVDNGSTDDTIPRVRATLPTVEILPLPENRGFAAGMNAGLRHALATTPAPDWTLLVNNDTVAQPGMLSTLLAAADTPTVGLVTPTVYRADAPTTVWPSAGRRRRLTLAAIDTTTNPPSSSPYDIDWANGCCILVRRALWQDIGLFDERYPFYYEDHDLCLRARGAGWRLRHAPQAAIHHKVAASTGEHSPRQQYLLARGSVPYYWHHTHGPHRALIVVYRLLSLTRTLARHLAAGRPAAARAYLRGLRDGLLSLRSDRGRGPASLQMVGQADPTADPNEAARA